MQGDQKCNKKEVQCSEVADIVHCWKKLAEHRVKSRNFAKIPGVDILWKDTVFAESGAICPKPCRNCAFPHNFHTRNLGEIALFFAVEYSIKINL